MTFSADGTSHLNINYNSCHVHLMAEEYNNASDRKHATCFLGIMSSLDGTSEQSLKDWDKTLETVADVFNRSPMGKRYGSIIRTVDVFAKLAGMLTDHCAKEKKDVAALEKRKIQAMYQKLGEDTIFSSTNAELLPNFLAAYNQMVKDYGGQEKWNNLHEDEQRERIARMTEKAVIELGKDAYEMLSDAEKRTLKLFIWAGCGCHKDLNTVKAGYAEMSTWWEENDVTPPVLLANRDNAAVLKEASLNQGDLTPAQERAFQMTARGGVKATQIAGAVFNHKDDKKGHQNTFRYWWEKQTKSEFTFPDTSNTRFQSHCVAAGVLILHKELIMAYLKFAQEKKQAGQLNHTEKNLLKALNCQATWTELAVLALYAQSVSHPYMNEMRTKQANMLDMGPYHHNVYAHMKKIISDPALLIGTMVSHETGTVDGTCWQSKETIEAIHNMKPDLPHLEALLVRFFKGAAKGWKHFTSEFTPGGLIDEATAEEKDMAWLPTTNDVNEGALGSFRVLMHRQPQLTVLQYNAQAMFHHNKTQAFMDAKFTSADDFKFLHKEARNLKGVDKQRKLEIIDYAEEKIAKKQKTAKERKEKVAEYAAKIANVELVLDRDKVVALTGERLRDQFSAFKAAGAPNMESLTKRSKVADIRKALQYAVDMYHESKWNPHESIGEADEEDGEVFDITGDDEDNWEDLPEM